MTDPNLRRLLEVAAQKQRDGEQSCKHYAIMRKQKIEGANDSKGLANFENVNASLQESLYEELWVNIIWIDEFSEIPEILKKISEHSALLSFLPDMYAYVDLDSDGIDELLIIDVHCLVLRYDGEKAIGYIIERISGVKTDGTFSVGEILDENEAGSISKVSFDGLDYEITNLAYKKGSENLYQLDQKPASKDEVENYFDNWKESTTDVSWTKIEHE